MESEPKTYVYSQRLGTPVRARQKKLIVIKQAGEVLVMVQVDDGIERDC